MPKRLMWSLLAVSIALPSAADEMLVFKKESAFKGAAMRVVSYQRKNGQLLISGLHGEVFSAAEAAVDWERTAKASESLHSSEDVEAARAAEEARAHRAAEARSEAKALGLVEASRRYGVDKPAVSVASGSAVNQSADAGRESEKSAPGAAAAASAASAASPAEIKAAKDRLAAAKADVDKLSKEIETIRADNNPDPLSSAQRQSRLKDKQKTLGELQKKVQAAEDALNRASNPEAAKKPPAETKPATAGGRK